MSRKSSSGRQDRPGHPARQHAGAEDRPAPDPASAEPVLQLLSRSGTAALATDLEGRVKWLNAQARQLLRWTGERSSRPCHELLGGLDVHGNRFCHVSCSVVAMARRGEAIRGFEMVLGDDAGQAQSHHVTVLILPGPTLVHLLQPIDREGRLARALERLGARGRPPGACADSPAGAPHAPLTPREAEVLAWVASGLANKEIAERLGIQLATARNHVHSILRKLDVHSKLEAVALAFHMGWIPAAQRRRHPAPSRDDPRHADC